MDLATDIAAEPTALPITDPFHSDSTAFCVTAFGINVNIDIAVFESTHQSGREFLPFAAWMYAYRLYAESEQPTSVTNNQIKRNPKTQKTKKRNLESNELEQNYQIAVFSTWKDQKIRLSAFVTFSGCYVKEWKENYVCFLETEGVGETIRGDHRPPTKTHQIAPTEILHNIKVHRVHQQDYHQLDHIVAQEQASEQIKQNSTRLQSDRAPITTLNEQWKKHAIGWLELLKLSPITETDTLETSSSHSTSHVSSAISTSGRKGLSSYPSSLPPENPTLTDIGTTGNNEKRWNHWTIQCLIIKSPWLEQTNK